MGNRALEKLLTFLLDAVVITASFWIAFWIRYRSGLFLGTYDPELLQGNFFIPATVLTGGWLLLFFLTGLYRDWFKESRLDEFFVVTRTVLFGLFTMFAIVSSDQWISFFKTGELPDLFNHQQSAIVFTYGVTLLIATTMNRFVLHTLHASFYRKGIGVRNLAIVGANDSADRLVREIETHAQLGYQVVGFLDEERTGEHAGHKILGTYGDIPTVTKDMKIDGLIISHLTNSAKDILDILKYCWDEKLTIYMEPSLMDVVSGHLKTHDVCGVPLVVLLQDHMPTWQAQVKRLFDLCFSLFLLIPFAPIWLLVALGVKLTSKGPAVYSQERIGQNGKPFIMRKFRSMYVDAEARSGPQWATENDPRITPFGRFMRKTRLDEIPQLVNVMRGEMSFVGPRPERQFFIEKLTKEIPWYIKRLKMKPGVTGWAQVKHGYDETIEDVKTKVMYDLYYFENMSLLLDLKILIQTIAVVLTGRGAK